MTQSQGPERRQYPRAETTLVVSYRVKAVSHGYDISQSTNVSQGGMLLKTNKAFDRGTCLDLTIRLPLIQDPIRVKGPVVISEQVVPNLIYDTRIQFGRLERSAFRKLNEFVKRLMP